MIYPNDIAAVAIATIALVQALFIAVLLHHLRKAEQIIKRQRAELAQKQQDPILAAFARAGMSAKEAAETINNNLSNNAKIGEPFDQK